MNPYIGFANRILYLASRLWVFTYDPRLIASTFSFMDFPLDAELLGLQGKARSTRALVTRAASSPLPQPFPATTNEDAGVIKAADYPHSRRPVPPKELFLVSL